MRIEQAADGGSRVTVSGDAAAALSRSWVEIMAWAAAAVPQGLGMPWCVAAEGGAVHATFPDRATALAFLGRFVPGGLSEVARGLPGGSSDYREVHEADGAVTVDLRWVGDAGHGSAEPHDATWEATRDLSEAAREAGFEAETLDADHDTASVRLVPAVRGAAAA